MKYPSLLALVATLFGCKENHHVATPPMNDTKYKIGQVWNYHTRTDESESRIYIVRAESSEKLGVIYHIYVDGIRIKNPHVTSGVQDCLPHSPVSEKTLDESVNTLAIEKMGALPDISEGYAEWKRAFDAGEGGIFTIPVSQIIQYIEDIVTGNTKKS